MKGLLFVFLLVLLMLPAIQAAPLHQEVESLVAYFVHQDDQYHVFVTNVLTGISRSLIKGDGEFSGLAWSPDGSQLAVTYDYGEGCDIYVYTISSDQLFRLTDSGKNYSPAWSPDGQYLAFTACEADLCEIHMMNNQGGDRIRLTEMLPFPDWLGWSSGGDVILFSSAEEIFLLSLEDGGPQRLTRGYSPKWSLDGSQIVYVLEGAVWVMNNDGSSAHQVSSESYPFTEVAWSPLGHQIAFLHDMSAIFLVNSDGSGEHRLLEGDFDQMSPTWSPDGRRLAFEAFQDGQFGIYMANADGSSFTRLAASGYRPVWQPASTGSSLAINTDAEIVQASSDNLATTLQEGTTGMFQLADCVYKGASGADVTIDQTSNTTSEMPYTEEGARAVVAAYLEKTYFRATEGYIYLDGSAMNMRQAELSLVDSRQVIISLLPDLSYSGTQATFEATVEGDIISGIVGYSHTSTSSYTQTTYSWNASANFTCSVVTLSADAWRPIPPAALTVTQEADGSLLLSWQMNDSMVDVQEYIIYRMYDNKQTAELPEFEELTRVNNTVFVDDSSAATSSHQFLMETLGYYVIAVGANGEMSRQSNPVFYYKQ